MSANSFCSIALQLGSLDGLSVFVVALVTGFSPCAIFALRKYAVFPASFIAGRVVLDSFGWIFFFISENRPEIEGTGTCFGVVLLIFLCLYLVIGSMRLRGQIDNEQQRG